MRLAEQATLMIEDAYEVARFGGGEFSDVGTEDPWVAGALAFGGAARDADLRLREMFQTSMVAGWGSQGGRAKLGKAK